MSCCSLLFVFEYTTKQFLYLVSHDIVNYEGLGSVNIYNVKQLLNEVSGLSRTILCHPAKPKAEIVLLCTQKYEAKSNTSGLFKHLMQNNIFIFTKTLFSLS